MKVLVTGGAGFIGSNLVRLVEGERPDWHVAVLDLLTYAGSESRLKDLDAAFFKADVADPDQVERVFSSFGPELVFHLAAETHVDRSIHDPAPFIRTNVLGTQVILDACTRHKVEKMVHVSTDEVYGPAGPGESFDESAAMRPRNPYSATKAAADHLVTAHHLVKGLDVVITRSTNNYGPAQHPEKFLPLLITNCMQARPLPVYGDGRQRRDWLYVEDHCMGLLAAAEKGRAGEVYNFSGRCEMVNLEVAEMVCRITGTDRSAIRLVRDRPAHDRRYSLDSSKAGKELGFEPGPPLEQRLADLVAWYRNNQQWWMPLKSGEFEEFYKRNYGDQGRETT